MANTVRVGAFLYRINPSNDKEMQRCPIGGNSWSRVTEFNGNHILDLDECFPSASPYLKFESSTAFFCLFLENTKNRADYLLDKKDLLSLSRRLGKTGDIEERK